MTNNNNSSIVKGDTDAAVGFLLDFCKDGPWHLCAIVPDGAITAQTFEVQSIREMRDFIENRQGRENLYFHVNTVKNDLKDKKAKKSDIARIDYLHADIDDPDGLDRLLNFKIKPTAIVFSGGGYNAYWKLNAPIADQEMAEGINRWLVEQLDGDSAATDVSRILRVPFTINLPTKKKIERGRVATLATLVREHSDWSRTYDTREFGQIVAARSTSEDLGSEPSSTTVICSEMPDGVSDWLRNLAELGDDSERPRGSQNARYPSRSEAVWALCCGLARDGVEEGAIAGILINPAYRISDSIIEKRDPAGAALRQVQRAIVAVGNDWPDGTQNQSPIPRRTLQNTQAALLRLGVRCWFDEFRQRPFIGGYPIQSFQGELSDRATVYLRNEINTKIGFDPGKDMTRDAIETLCQQTAIDPVCDYLASLVWDGTHRIDRWLVEYAGSEDTPYIRSVGAIMLIAAVRRARTPGVKFDTIPVLEGPQGSGKSTMIRILAGDDFFSDQDILGLDQKAQMEALDGVWIFEISELAGIRKTDVSKVKSFASRSWDRARPAYGRYTEKRPRRGILIGTTNDEKYLKDRTGNRRFWPISTGQIDLKGLAHVRDQLWAEAVLREAQNAKITLPRGLWSSAELEQQKRVEDDVWEPILADVEGIRFNGREVISTRVLLESILDIKSAQLNNNHSIHLGEAMRSLGWTGPTTITLPTGKKCKGYWRLPEDPKATSGPILP